MTVVARPRRASGVARAVVVVSLLTLAVGCAPDRPDLGAVLPADTAAWLTCRQLDTLEGVLEQHGLMPLLVGELADPQVRRQLTEDWGLELSDDPRRDVHAVLSRLDRLDVSLHPRVGADSGTAPGVGAPAAEAPHVAVWLLAQDTAAAAEIEAFLADVADSTTTRDDQAWHRLAGHGDAAEMWALRDGARLLAASDADLLHRLHARLRQTPDGGLAAVTRYQRVRGAGDHDLEIYLAGSGAGELPAALGAGPLAAMSDLAPLLARYGDQAAWLGLDYLLTGLVGRTFYGPDHPLAGMLDDPMITSELVELLPADAHAAQVLAVHEPRAKLQLMRDLAREAMASAPAGQQVPPLAGSPFAALEAALGFSLADLAEELSEVAVAGATEPGLLLLLRAHDAAAASRVQEMLGTSPALGFLAEMAPHVAAGDTLRVFTAPMDADGRLHALGRHDRTVMLLLLADQASEFDTYLASLRAGAALPDAAAPLAGPHLAARGNSWLYLDLPRLAAAWELPLGPALAELPAPLAARLRALVLAGHAHIAEDGVVENVVSVSGP
jgi:hypothetical protein